MIKKAFDEGFISTCQNAGINNSMAISGLFKVANYIENYIENMPKEAIDLSDKQISMLAGGLGGAGIGAGIGGYLDGWRGAGIGGLVGAGLGTTAGWGYGANKEFQQKQLDIKYKNKPLKDWQMRDAIRYAGKRGESVLASTGIGATSFVIDDVIKAVKKDKLNTIERMTKGEKPADFKFSGKKVVRHIPKSSFGVALQALAPKNYIY